MVISPISLCRCVWGASPGPDRGRGRSDGLRAADFAFAVCCLPLDRFEALFVLAHLIGIWQAAIGGGHFFLFFLFSLFYLIYFFFLFFLFFYFFPLLFCDHRAEFCAARLWAISAAWLSPTFGGIGGLPGHPIPLAFAAGARVVACGVGFVALAAFCAGGPRCLRAGQPGRARAGGGPEAGGLAFRLGCETLSFAQKSSSLWYRHLRARSPQLPALGRAVFAGLWPAFSAEGCGAVLPGAVLGATILCAAAFGQMDRTCVPRKRVI